ncbi:hypothetical protein M409DRAFT_22999 [Zasmidium cellare ATCC 36951]|uniref:PPPDE domain-containing protein n=1 Tax=Zasmidium cellare ATCC 36951 TaxID=1080233 RepID=A0A6A6CM02_ZASCE|nr:uncharacterized protein M409DRAFT_22999 [Zasmidium cellare ATCC 36951]KAF2166952.1 hypothetical protein M409DRAFT_22999 [Zasmidium cellare ATCC 36951]
MSELKDIYWMAAPLAAKYRVDFNKDLDQSWGAERGFRLPSRAKGSLRKFYHWALEIDGTCYEVSPNEKCQGLGIFVDACVPKPCPSEEWHARYVGVEPETRKIGQTRKVKEEIMACIDDIWNNWNQGRYDFLIQNCQNFVKMVFEQIIVSEDDPEVIEEEKKTWMKMPDPVSHRLAEGSQATLLGGAMYGTHAAYLAALTSVVEAGQTGGLVAAGVAANTIEGTAAGTALAEGSTGAATVASGSQGAGAQATHASLTATAHANPAGAVGVAKSTTTGTSGAAKAGFSAKAAGLGHVGLHGAGLGAAKAASIGGGMLKAGGTAMFVHPIAGAAIAGAGAGLVYLGTRGKRDKNWTPEMPSSPTEDPATGLNDLEVEVTTDDLLELEARLFEQVEMDNGTEYVDAKWPCSPAPIEERMEECKLTDSHETDVAFEQPKSSEGTKGKIRQWRQKSWKS